MGTFYARTLGSPLFLCLCPESKSRRILASPPALQEPPPHQVPEVASQRAMLRAPGGSQAHAHLSFGFTLWLDGQAGTRPPSPAFLFGGRGSSPFRTYPLHALGFSFPSNCSNREKLPVIVSAGLSHVDFRSPLFYHYVKGRVGRGGLRSSFPL